MKPIFCKECKWNKNGWCYKYECNGPKRVEVCPKYRDEDLKERRKKAIWSNVIHVRM